jgi:hypothetical protein
LRGKASRIVGLRGFVEDLLKSDAFEARMGELASHAPRRIVNPLLSFLYSPDELIKWRAVTAVGFVVARMADEEMEWARVVMRRLIWSLNDESGGIGWGAPEAMGEIMANHERVAEEFSAILVSYIREDGNPLENGLLERGVLWGIGRLAQRRPGMVQGTVTHLAPYLASAWVLGFVDAAAVMNHLKPLLQDPAKVHIFEKGRVHDYRICDLAGKALGKE